jgi:stress response protein YsnF
LSDEVRMPVTEEEVVVEKRPEVKEEIRVRKDVAREEEVVEKDVRKEEVDVEDETERRGALGRDTDADDEARPRNR